MTFLKWQNPTWRKRFWTVMAVLLFIVFASHPELRILLLLLDVVGVELLVALLGLQFKTFFSGMLMPLFYQSWRILVPIFKAANDASISLLPLRFVRDFYRYALFNWVDYVGPQAWHSLHKLFRAAQLGPNNSFKPNWLRQSA